MRRFATELHRLAAARDGTTAIEYAIIAAGVAGVLIATVTALGGSVTAMFTAVAAAFS
ncbi:MAG TPA: Flp family type IVb pilin [Pseudolabrys sp.]|nr:Flp family type IVb pilin [Pseudolabrys sp.]